MRKLIAIMLMLFISLTGCSVIRSMKMTLNTTPTATPTANPDTASNTVGFNRYEDQMYKTTLSPDNQIGIVKHPQAVDYSFIHPEGLKELPVFNEKSNEMWQVDLRSTDISGLNLEGRLKDLLYSSFDSKTKWPEKLPGGFDLDKIMELGKNPGLGLRQLHAQGITGKGVGLAIIDQTLLVDHIEYKDQIKMYEEIHNRIGPAAMHGPAVASIAVGKTVGVAPEANLYYIAESHERNNNWDLSYMAESIDRIVEVNRLLPEDEKIRVISISLGIMDFNGHEKVYRSIEAAKKEGIYTVYVESDPYFGLGRDPFADPDDPSSYTEGLFWKDYGAKDVGMLFPMDSRCTASPTGEQDYVFYRQGGMSWAVPYVAGIYALACQVKPDITPELFWETAADTGVMLYNGKTPVGKIIDPAALIDKLK